MSMAAGTSTYTSISPRPKRSGSAGLKIGGAVAAIAFVLGGYWSITQLTTTSKASTPSGGWMDVSGGQIKLGAARKTRQREGFMRFTLDVTVQAGDKALVVDGSSFRIDGYHVYLGMEPVKSQPSVKKIRAGKEMDFTLTYQVTDDANDFTLIYEGGAHVPFEVKKKKN